LFLEHGMTVVPVGAVLHDRETELMCLSGFNRLCGQVRDAIFLVGQYQAMPVDGSFFMQGIVNIYFGGVSFGEVQGGTGNGSINGQCMLHFSGIVHHGIAHVKIVTDGFLCKDSVTGKKQ